MNCAPYAGGGVRGFLHEPEASAVGGVVLTHGAGSNSQSPLLVAVAQVFCEAGFVVLRCDLPFRQKRVFGPPPPASAADDRAGLHEAAGQIRQRVAGPVILGGHSYGGRQASMLAADEPGVADALLLLSYPLHPPKRAEQLRTAHWPNLRTPCFFVHGTKDPFGSIEELRAAFSLLPSRPELAIVEGAGHDLKRGKFDVGSAVAGVLKHFR